MKKLFLTATLFFLMLNILSPQSFSVSGPSSAVIPFGQTSKGVSFSISYDHGGATLYFPRLNVSVDDVVITKSWCEDNKAYEPATFTVNLSAGSHIVTFTYASLDPNYGDCHHLIVLGTKIERTVNVYGVVRIKNNFDGGSIYVANSTTPKTAPQDVNVLPSTQVYLGAIEQDISGIKRVWNTSGVASSLSSWKITRVGENPTALSAAQNFTYTITGSDINAVIEADLKKSYKVTRTDRTEFDGDFANQATIYIVDGNSGAMPAPAVKTVGSKTYNFVGWDGINASNFIPTANMTVTALYKTHLLTTSSTGFTPNNQIKYLIDPYSTGGPSYIAYESMGKIWFTRGSSNGGYGTEILVSQSNEFGLNLVEAKNPSIALSNDGSNFLFITYQAKYTDESEMLVLKIYNVTNTCIGSAIVNYYVPYTHNAGAMVSSYSTVFTIVYKPSPDSKLWQTSYAKSGLDTWPLFEDFELTFTTSTSSNPSYAFSPALGNRDVIVYQNSNTEVLYKEYIKLPNEIVIYNPATLSASNGYTYNYNPVMKLVNSGYPLVYWAARNSSYPVFLIKERNSGGWTTGFQTGGITDVASCGVANAADRAVLAWYSGMYNPCMSYVKRDPAQYPTTGYSPIIQVPSVTATPHLSNGYVHLTDIKAVTISAGAAPYAIAPLNYDFNYDRLNKENEVPTTYGRSIVVNKKGVDHVFYLGGIKLNGENVMFITRPDTLPVNTSGEATEAMTSESIDIKSGDKLEAAYYNYVLHKELSDKMKAGEYVQFSLEAVNKKNGNKSVLHTVKFTKDNLQDSTEQIIEINTDNIQSGSYILRAVADVKGEAAYSLMNHQNISNGKKDLEKIDLSDELKTPTVYALSQNYPNPFNPSTVISYDIPEASRVTLKVYDILGREVADLVNEFKEAGRYNVKFDASHLSTGIYIYQLRANDYVSVKKMSFVK